MSEPIKREFRNRPLSSEEVESDAKVREQVMQEFPPATHRVHQPQSDSLAEVLRSAINSSGETTASLAKKTGLSQQLLELFAKGERDIRISTAEKLAAVLGVKLVASQ